MIVAGQNGTRWFILKDMGYGFFKDDEDVFAVKLQENGLPHDDPVVFLVDEFDWPQDEIDNLKRMILSVLTTDLSAEEIETLNALSIREIIQ
jgi:hypothetical protein